MLADCESLACRTTNMAYPAVALALLIHAGLAGVARLT